MNPLFRLSQWIDALNEHLGKLAAWGVLLSCLISAGNAIIRYLLDRSSNAWLEGQWYLFSLTVLLGAGWVLKLNEHVRVDVIYGGRSSRTKACIDLVGLLLFLTPSMLLLAKLSWPLFINAFNSGEMSSNAGGLIRWPAYLLMPLGFGLVALQGVSEIIKRIGFLCGKYNMDTHYERPLQ